MTTLGRVSGLSSPMQRGPGRGRGPSASPSGVIMMFDGLMSRWTSPASCAASRPSSTLRKSRAASGTRSGPPCGRLDHLVEALARDVLQDHEVDVALVADVERPGQVRVLDPPREVHLAAEPEQRLASVGGLARRQDLDRHRLAVALGLRRGRPCPSPPRRAAGGSGSRRGRSRGSPRRGACGPGRG